MKSNQFIKNFLRQGQNDHVEFKEFAKPEDIARSVCGFLNAKGGIILIGVKTDGKVVGIKKPDELESELRRYLFHAVIPETPISISVENHGIKSILLIKVWNGSRPPYLFDGNIFIRRNKTTSKANPREISRLIVERQKAELHWERQPALGFEFHDLDEFEIRKTLQDIRQFGRGKEFKDDEILEFLTHYGMYKNGYLTNAAVVLFAKYPTQFLPQCRVRITVFKGTKTSDQFIYDKFFEDHLFSIRNQVEQFFRVNIASPSFFTEKSFLREDLPFPISALDEGLMNALLHRDYSQVSGSVHIAFYPDRLEIINIGELFGGYTPSDLGRDHLSIPRNPDIAQICFIRMMIEKIGRGTVMMIADCESKGYPKPHWESKSGYTTLTFPEVTVTAKTDSTDTTPIDDAVNDAVNDAVKRKKIDAVSDAVSDALKDTVKVILAGVTGVSIHTIMDKTGKSNATVKRYLHTLKEIGLIEFKGAAKTGKYFMKAKQLKMKK